MILADKLQFPSIAEEKKSKTEIQALTWFKRMPPRCYKLSYKATRREDWERGNILEGFSTP